MPPPSALTASRRSSAPSAIATPVLGTLERVGADVVERRLDARAGEHRTHAGAHRAGADDGSSLQLAHVVSLVFCLLESTRQTRSGVSGSSVTGTPASATAVAIAAVVPASEPSPQPLAP